MPANAGDGRDEISIPELEDPLEEEMATALQYSRSENSGILAWKIQIFLLGKYYGQRRLADYSPGGCKELGSID